MASLKARVRGSGAAAMACGGVLWAVPLLEDCSCGRWMGRAWYC